MRFPQAYVQRAYSPSGALPVTGSNTVVPGNPVDGGLASICLGARVSVSITTNNVTLAFKWQVLDDASTSAWIDVVESNNSAYVVLLTGNGTIATATKLVSAPLVVGAGNRVFRGVIYSATTAGVGGTSDFGSIEYDFRNPINQFGT